MSSRRSFADRMRRADARMDAAVGETALVRGVEVQGSLRQETMELVSGDHRAVDRRTVFSCQIADLPARTLKDERIEINGKVYIIRAFDPPEGDDVGRVSLVLGK